MPNRYIEMRPEVIKREELGDNVDAAKPPRLTRSLGLAFFGVCLILVVAAYAFTRPMHDFVEYWTASHLLVARENPFSLTGVFRFQKALGWSEPLPLTFVSPPWALSLTLPLGFMKSYGLAWLLWFVMMATAVAYASRLLVDIYFGDIRLPEITEFSWQRCLFALTFYPVLVCLKFSQTTPLILMGLAGFCFFERRRRDFLAGLFLSLTLVKPQLLLLVWLAFVFWWFKQRRWAMLASILGGLALLAGVALLLDSRIFNQYLELIQTPYLSLNPSGMVAGLRGSLGARNTYWVQFVPAVLGILWLSFYWRKHRDHWNWTERMPALVAASILTTAYGWLFDQTLLAVPIIALAGMYAKRTGKLPRNLVALYTALNATLILLAMASTPWAFVPAPIVVAFLLYREARAGSALSSSVRYTFAGNPS